MRVTVHLRREGGVFRQPYGLGGKASGDLHLTHVTADGRKIPALQLLGADQRIPRLFEPRVVELSADKIRFLGFERVERAWVMQEWDCELQR